ncbi:putative AH/BAR domain superfamily protein [Helianthus annuus]|nr:putative AH/BAR domain superfamily protein [Helianthus annuus]
MTSIQMPKEFGFIFPQEGDTGADAPAGCLTLWADFFFNGNLRVPLTVFVAEVLEHYKIHISQLSPFGMIRIRHFEYTFRALGLDVTVENFRRFYQLTVNTGFFSFSERYGSTKLMTSPKGITKWKTKFFYIKAAAVAANMTLRNVNETIPAEDIALPSVKTVEWFPRLKTIEFKKLDNSQLWILRMMLTRPDRKARPVLREKSGEDAALWRIFNPTFLGKVELLPCAEGEGFNLTIVDNFRVPKREALNAPLPQGKGNLGALGEFEAKAAPKKHAEKKHVEKAVQGRGKKKPEASVVPPLVPQAASISHSCFRRYTDYVVVSDTLEGLGVPGGGAPAGGTSAGSKPADKKKKRKPEEKAADAGEKKCPRIQIKRTTAVSQAKPAVAAEPQDGDFSFLFDAPHSPTHDVAADAGVDKEFSRSPFVKVVSEPSVQAGDTGKNPAAQIFDMMDSHNNLITPQDTDDLNLRFGDAEKKKSPAAEKASGSASGGAGSEGPPIQPEESELEFYFRTYTEDRSMTYHRPPWNVMQGDDISSDPSACKEILGGLGTPFEVNRARALPHELWINQLSSMLVGSSIMANAIMEDYKVLGRKEEETARLRAEAEELVKAAREGAEQLKREKAAFEQYKQTEEWSATAGLKQVRTLAKLLSDERKSWKETLSDERKSWKESWAKQNEKLFYVRQEVTNLKAANAALMKEKSAVEVVAKEAKEAEVRAAKALEEAKEAGARVAMALEVANADRISLNKTIEGLQAKAQSRVTMLAEVTARVSEAEAREREAAEARDSLISSFDQLKDDRDWMHDHGIGHAILDAPKNATGVDLIRLRAREAGFIAGYNRCISHINVLSQRQIHR